MCYISRLCSTRMESSNEGGKTLNEEDCGRGREMKWMMLGEKEKMYSEGRVMTWWMTWNEPRWQQEKGNQQQIVRVRIKREPRVGKPEKLKSGKLAVEGTGLNAYIFNTDYGEPEICKGKELAQTSGSPWGARATQLTRIFYLFIETFLSYHLRSLAAYKIYSYRARLEGKAPM